MWCTLHTARKSVSLFHDWTLCSQKIEKLQGQREDRPSYVSWMRRSCCLTYTCLKWFLKGLGRAARPPNCCSKCALPRHLEPPRPGSALSLSLSIVSLPFDTHQTIFMCGRLCSVSLHDFQLRWENKQQQKLIITGTYRKYSQLRFVNHYGLKQTHRDGAAAWILITMFSKSFCDDRMLASGKATLFWWWKKKRDINIPQKD